ncbi:hypothetical protein ACSX1A_03015 [Pontibacter sp. MBLB2868]
MPTGKIKNVTNVSEFVTNLHQTHNNTKQQKTNHLKLNTGKIGKN